MGQPPQAGLVGAGDLVGGEPQWPEWPRAARARGPAAAYLVGGGVSGRAAARTLPVPLPFRLPGVWRASRPPP